MSQSEQEFAGRVALVTGGSRGIGRACVLQLAEAGADVAINYVSREDAARETAEAAGKFGVRTHVVQADVSSADDVHHMVEEVTSSLGPVDLLVNNAGVFDYVSHEETTPEIWHRAIETNLTSAYLVTWAVKDGMMERGYGRIVNIASIAALRPRPMSIAYAVSKAGVVALTQSTSEALAPHGVRINCVAPGLTETEILDGVDQAALDRLIAETPLGRIGQPEDISELVMFLLSDRSRFMTGQTLVASGGRVLIP
ncbi:MAG: 3-oxoacyl-ACP reductase FabG [Planctomycetota bacterium]|nr:MAG: 3-oxoacyl-ACP reductase FabG [Planctomycetota bacterium]REK22814.1 MAG: 3-oxoacyl-ACP reductase FabG [Planctomycetota bacterium]REK31579.1 MAG: 3-oxoacyl-ACP reductase FabG [Planctomycetota bacterium]